MISTGQTVGWARTGRQSQTAGLSISSQAVLGSSATAGDIRIGETYPGDQWSQVEVTSTQLSGGQWIGPAVRMQNGGQNMYLGIYFWNSGSQQLRLYKRSAGTWIQLGNSYNRGALAAGTQLRLTAIGSTISFLQNGVTRVSVTDTSVTGGAPGIMTFGTAKADNWAGGSASLRDLFGWRQRLGSCGTVVLAGQRRRRPDRSARTGRSRSRRSCPDGAAYSVTVKTNPAGQTCSVATGRGRSRPANVTNVAVTCTSVSTYSVGGNVTGLSGTVVLQDNGGDDLTRERERPVHVRDQAGRRRRLQRDGEDQPARADLQRLERLRRRCGSANVTNVVGRLREHVRRLRVR